ncbi:hypothetical protein F5X99DRAFT_337786 [Biscogniauxia marginata]|nr:hypothetical protein F5X99DRAFT_337786 [Biscogniauxia marginata]
MTSHQISYNLYIILFSFSVFSASRFAADHDANPSRRRAYMVNETIHLSGGDPDLHTGACLSPRLCISQPRSVSKEGD